MRIKMAFEHVKPGQRFFSEFEEGKPTEHIRLYEETEAPEWRNVGWNACELTEGRLCYFLFHTLVEVEPVMTVQEYIRQVDSGEIELPGDFGPYPLKGIMSNVLEWIQEGWGLEDGPEPEQVAACLLMTAAEQDGCVERGESDRDFPVALRAFAKGILELTHPSLF